MYIARRVSSSVRDICIYVRRALHTECSATFSISFFFAFTYIYIYTVCFSHFKINLHRNTIGNIYIYIYLSTLSTHQQTVSLAFSWYRMCPSVLFLSLSLSLSLCYACVHVWVSCIIVICLTHSTHHSFLSFVLVQYILPLASRSVNLKSSSR